MPITNPYPKLETNYHLKRDIAICAAQLQLARLSNDGGFKPKQILTLPLLLASGPARFTQARTKKAPRNNMFLGLSLSDADGTRTRNLRIDSELTNTRLPPEFAGFQRPGEPAQYESALVGRIGFVRLLCALASGRNTLKAKNPTTLARNQVPAAHPPKLLSYAQTRQLGVLVL